MNKLVVGLTGGIGSGKSQVAGYFAQLGARIVDADAIAHALTATAGAALPALRQTFGDQIFTETGELDRGALRQRVFTQSSAKAQLEAILHPLIYQESLRRLAELTPHPYTILVVPLLVETGIYQQHCQRILVVDCSSTTQIARVMARDGVSAAAVRAILRQQASREERLAAADDVILNENSLDQLLHQIEILHRQYSVLQ